MAARPERQGKCQELRPQRPSATPRARQHVKHTFCIWICRECGNRWPSSHVALRSGRGCARGCRPSWVCAGESHGATLGLLAILHGLKQPGKKACVPLRHRGLGVPRDGEGPYSQCGSKRGQGSQCGTEQLSTGPGQALTTLGTHSGNVHPGAGGPGMNAHLTLRGHGTTA